MSIFILCLFALMVASYVLGAGRAKALVSGNLAQVHSLPFYHGAFVALMAAITGGVIYGIAS